MALLLVGLVLFIGIHSIRLFAPEWRQFMMEQLGTKNWKLMHSAVAVTGLLTIIMGYGYARYSAEWLWYPPVWTRHIAALLVLVAFFYVIVAAMPYSKTKSRIGVPMVVGVKLWAFAHLISNGTTADVVLFGSFLAWAVINFVISKRRIRSEKVVYQAPDFKYDILALVLSLVAYYIVAFHLHAWLIGVAPFA
ncbi:NnrU family protein [Marinomonas ostreistagni]|uniref:NnrU family protein n=1 Tax=Marinomonas ostreistagni TaxID=359209 RepID=A0ABS0ZCH6_9GAMM|nr:NnrU family protein [Marinomonas ostreistagni]MBJ7551354.1 NnrU family protein [Marinomonas ostreistagni]